LKSIGVSEARANLYKLVEQASVGHEPVKITSKKGNAVMISEDDWLAVEETLYLLSVPGMRESIVQGMETPLDKCAPGLDW
jgi:prevent-host-death family protein